MICTQAVIFLNLQKCDDDTKGRLGHIADQLKKAEIAHELLEKVLKFDEVKLFKCLPKAMQIE